MNIYQALHIPAIGIREYNASVTEQVPLELRTVDTGEDILDSVGVGFGSSNLSIFIPIEEENVTRISGEHIGALFLEKQQKFTWHDGMLPPGTDMQISFLKDLEIQRHPHRLV